MTRTSDNNPRFEKVRELFSALEPGDLLLLGARPGHGKTLMGLELLGEALRAGKQGAFFTLEYTEAQVFQRFQSLGLELSGLPGRFTLDASDGICSDHIIAALDAAPRGSVAVIDYLQLLDQRRSTPTLMLQVQALRAFAKERGLILVFISQIDRSYEASSRSCPQLEDVRLPNPLDLTLFHKACFLHADAVAFGAVG